MARSLWDVIVDGPFSVTPRPRPIPGDLRLPWGVALVLLVLAHSRGQRASLQKLHFLSHATRTPQSRDETLRALAGRIAPSAFLVRFEPWVGRALAFAQGAGLVERASGKSIKLSDAGSELARAILSAEVMEAETEFLVTARSLATEATIAKLMRTEALF